MPHVPIVVLEELRAIFDQLDGYADTLHDNIEAGQYTGAELTQAENLLSDMESLAVTINNANRSVLDSCVGAVETFLGI